MNKHRLVSSISLLVEVFVLASVGSMAQTLNPRDHLAQINYPQKGVDLLRTYCAACHGLDAKGNGPVAPALKVKVPDLTALARNNRGQFPAAHVRQMISGDQVVASHGSRDMPIWGPVFQQVEKDQGLPRNVKMENLMQYLESIQQK